MTTARALIFSLLLIPTLAACNSPPRAGEEHGRKGDEIVIAGRFFHTGAPVVLWTDPGGYDAYRVERRFVPFEQSTWEQSRDSLGSPNRYNLRYQATAQQHFTPEQLERIRGGGWDLDLLQQTIDQFVIHYDVSGTSRTCFRILHDTRGLSVHFMLDLDGTIYQTLDVKERAWHASTSNDRSVGIEIANMGAYPPAEIAAGKAPLAQWYEEGTGRITLPARLGDGGIRTPNFQGYSSRPEPVVGEVQGETRAMYDLTPEQYDSLIKLTAALCTVLPQIACDYPRDDQDRLIISSLPQQALETYRGLLGHYHIQANKQDPGPAFDWDRVVNGARKLMPKEAAKY